MFCILIPAWLAALDQRVDLAHSTKVTYARIGAHLRAWASRNEEAPLDLHPYVAERRAAGVAPRTLALELRVAAVAFRWGQQTGRVSTTASLRVPRLRIDPQDFVLNHRTPTPGQAGMAIQAMAADAWRLAALVLARTGAPVGEVVRLRSCDLDELAGRLARGRVSGARKSGTRWFPMDPASLHALEGRSGHGEAPLFDFGGTTAPIQCLARRLRQACALAGVPAFTPHGLRRMVVGRLLRARIDPGTAASPTGHTVEVMLTYSSLSPRRASEPPPTPPPLANPDRLASTRASALSRGATMGAAYTLAPRQASLRRQRR